MRHIRLFLRFAGTMFGDARRSAATLLAWLAANTLLEGFGLLLLIPLLHAAGIGGADPAGPLATLLSGTDLDPLLAVLTLYVGVVAIQALVRYVASIRSARFQAHFVARLRARLYDALLKSPWERISALRARDVAYQLTTNMQHTANAAYQTMLLLHNALFAVVYLAFALWIAPAAALVLIPLGALLYLPLARRYRHTAGEAERMVRSLREHEGRGQNFVRRFRHIRAFGRQEHERHRQAEEAREIAESTVSVARHIAAAQSIQTIAAVGVLAATTWIALRALALDLADLVVLLYAFFRLFPRLGQLQRNSQQILSMMPAFRSLHEFRGRLGEPGGPAEETRTSARVDNTAGIPEIRTLEIGPVTIPDRLRLENTLSLHRSQLTVLVGESGAGKSTLCDVLTGFLPGMEEARINGDRPAPEMRDALFARTAYLEQETTIWQESVREALLWAAPDASERELHRVLGEVELGARIERAPEGLETPIGDGAHWLSGGELKRLALAQVLLREPRLIVLDEFTANLDSVTERRLLSLLERLKRGRLILVVSHRRAARRFGDAVWELTRDAGGRHRLLHRQRSPAGGEDHVNVQTQ